MRDQMIPYLLELLESEERQQLDSQLALDESQRFELELLNAAIDWLEVDDELLSPGSDLVPRVAQRLFGNKSS